MKQAGHQHRISSGGRSPTPQTVRGLPKPAHSPIARILIAINPAEIEEIWRGAEEELIVSPYQSYAWYTAWIATAGARRGEEPVIVIAFDCCERPIAILPLIKRRNRGGLVVCEFAGGRHSNANFGLFAPSLSKAVDLQMMRWILHEINRQVGRVDTFAFVNMPLSWAGHVSWMCNVGGHSSPSNLHATTIASSFEEWQAAWLSPSRRKKLRQKLSYLSRIGPTRFIEAKSPTDVERVLAVFYRQKRQRFERLGLDDPFTDTDIKDFLRTVAQQEPSGQSGLAVRLFALEVDGKIVSTMGAAVSGRACSAMFLSFDDDVAARIASPGEFLVAQVIRTLCERGFKHFDLGIGKAAYKERYCALTVPLRDFYVGMSFGGLLLAKALHASMIIKRILKKLGYTRTIGVTITRLRRLFSLRQAKRFPSRLQ